ncbi:aryl-alcohol dehydrogenase-like predicted oxidoreductase [Sphingopyxis italica]|uniref:Aryl-alcohol dehydrogenase-like predicted oxidoreductase n=1 Tax=Sphingopyxis italica TaxID=1129133 RepID=A0A7X5XRY3_9SPHN|nr:aldo/keto reductase [Sphingopyxis italica]NJB90180.1 aryl-alcohol dehydrogenase-like predicted oxidoreductase [Sphingopyxis italica]
MRYRLLGKSGLRVSQVALGTMTFGTAADWSRPEEECRPVFDAFVEAGGNFIDTANMYTGGESERIVGRMVAPDRDRFVIASKYANAVPGGGDPNAAGMHRKSLTRSLDASLKRLGVDYIDLYFVHWWDFTTPVEEVQRALDDAVSAGKILHIGLSDVPAWVVSRAQAFHDLRGLVPVSAMQLEYSLVQRSIEREHLPLAQAHDIAVTAWSPLAGGILSGKYTRGTAGDGNNRMDSMQLQPLDERNREIALALDKIADGLGATSGQVALAWMMARGVIPIVGATRAEQLTENLRAVELVLSDEKLADLDAASAFDAGHPYSMLEWDMPMALGYGGMFDQIDIPRFPGRR